MKIKKNEIIMVAIIGILGIMVFTTQTVQTVYAYNFTVYNTAVAATSIAYDGSNTVVTAGSTSGDRLTSYSINDLSTELSHATCTDCVVVIYYNGNYYATGATTITKYAISSTGILFASTSLSTTSQCNLFDANLNTTNGEIICSRGSTDDYLIIDLDTMTVVYDSATLNAGVHPCDNPIIDSTNWNKNYFVATCAGGIMNTYTIGTETLLFNTAITTNNSGHLIAQNAFSDGDDSILLYTTTVNVYRYDTSSGFSVIASDININPSTGGVSPIYDSSAKRFILPASDSVGGIDPTTGTVLFNVAPPVNYTGGEGSVLISSSRMLYTTGTNKNIVDFNTVGLPAGSGGTIPGGSTTGVDCTNPQNAGILICRLTAETGGNIGGLGGILDTGVFSVFVNAGIIDGSNTNPATNGVGYFITIIGFGIMTAVLWISSGGRLSEIPTFIWFIGSLSLIGAMTAIGWLDPTFIIISVIAIVALAVAKTKSSLFSDDFGSGAFK